MFEQGHNATRSPLKARALRNPSEYLGEEIKRLQTEGKQGVLKCK
jgi:hypothetical protein